jgi:hypothetical protein
VPHATWKSGLALALAAIASIAAARDAATAEREINVASAAFDRAQLTHDRAALDRVLASDFKYVRGSGKFTGRDDFIAGFTDPEVTFEPFVITNRMFVPLGENAGIVGGEGVIRGRDHGTPFEEHFRYADTFGWRDGRWQVVYVQVTPIK